MCRLACKFITSLKRVCHTHTIGLAERQHSQTLPGLDTCVPPMCSGADWVKRCRSSSSSSTGHSLAQDQELLDSDPPDEVCASSPVAKCKHEALDGVIAMPGIKVDTAHIADSSPEGGIPAPAMSDTRFNVAHIPNLGAEALQKAEAIFETPSMRVSTSHLIQHRREDFGGEEAIGSRELAMAAVCRDGFAGDNLCNSRKVATLDDYLTESWDEDLENAIIRCSDASSLESKSEDTGMVNCKVEVADCANPPGLRSTHMASCEDDASKNVDGVIPNLSDAIEASRESKVVAQNMSVDTSFNASQLSSHLQEDFVYNYNDNELSGDGLLSHPDDIPLKFSQQQMDVLEAVACGKSVFITGSAGTGKSFLLMYIIRMLKKAVGKESVYVTASTGLAACALNGITLHSFAGVGLGSGTREGLAGRVLRRKESRKRWQNAQVLVIDEISMIDGELFDKLEYVARIVRKTASCFGGIQLIVTGDFFQLPPVNPPNHRKFFAFQADCWNKCFDLQIELEHVFRQSDSTFVKMLNEIRKGIQTPETVKNLSMCQRALPDDGTDIAPTRLYPLKVDVKLENMQELKALQTNIITFYSVDSAPNPLHRYMLDGLRTEKELQLCVGAQVMLVKNIDTCGGLVNGAKGVVIGFQSTYAFVDEKDEERDYMKSAAQIISPSNLWPVVRFSCGTRTIGPQKDSAEDGGVEVVSRIQVPLILAWALSVHKCQGMTLNKVQTDLSKAFDFGMVYVALSRVKDLDGLQLFGFDPTRIKVHPNVLTFFDKLIVKV